MSHAQIGFRCRKSAPIKRLGLPPIETHSNLRSYFLQTDVCLLSEPATADKARPPRGQRARLFLGEVTPESGWIVRVRMRHRLRSLSRSHRPPTTQPTKTSNGFKMTPNYAPSPVALSPVGMPTLLNYHHDINPDLSAGMRAAKSMMAAALGEATAFNTRRGMVDETMTEAANLAAVGKLADKIAEKVLVAYDKASNELANSTAQAETALASAVDIRPAPNAGEIRSVLRSMTVPKRQQTIISSFKARDRELIGAVVGQNALLHGVDTKLIAVMVENYKQDVAPHEFASLAEHRKAQRHLERARSSLLGWMADMHKGTRNFAQRKASYDALISSFGYED